MSTRTFLLSGLAALVVAATLFLLFSPTPDVVDPAGSTTDRTAPITQAAGDNTSPAAAEAAETARAPVRQAVPGADAATGVRGVVVDGKTRQPLGGVEVTAVRELPSFEPLVNRFRGLFTEGLWQQSHQPMQVLGSAISNPDGTFEIRGLPPGRVFLDGRSDGWFVRTAGTARLARGEFVEGIELRASPGGRVRGTVLSADGAPVAGAAVTLRPGLNAFLGQITERNYRWLEAVADDQGRFDLPGVPPGTGYIVSATSPTIALEEQFGVGVQQGQVTEVRLTAHPGALIAGTVKNGDGAPVAGANIALVYLDMTRVLFSADGRDQPITTDQDGRFRIERVAAGRVAFVAAADGLAPSNIEELAVVDGGIYDGLELRLGEGTTLVGTVVDDRDQPVPGAAVEVRPLERPNDPQFLKMMLKIRRVATTTDAQGRFTAAGMTGDRLIVQASKPGYTTALRTGVKLDEKDLKVQIQRGAVVRGKVVLADGTPVQRFRVDARSRPARAQEAAGNAAGNAADPQQPGAAGNDPTGDEDPDADDERARGGMRMQFGNGRRGRGDPFERSGTMQFAEGRKPADAMNPDGNWREVQAADGAFELTGVPPGRIRVRVRAEGFLDAEAQNVELAAGQVGEPLTFTLSEGLAVTGTVIDGTTGLPMADAQVTAYKNREERRRGINFQVDPEDFDFMAQSATMNSRSTISDSRGRFRIAALEAGKYRFTARHPDLAKASAKDVEVAPGKVVDVEIVLEAGGGIEGTVTGFGSRPLVDALIVAFSISAGSFKSSNTDQSGFYRIDGLPPGQYIVFKSRMEDRSADIGLDLMSNMRLKAISVRDGKFTRLDIEDESEDGVRVHGLVREGGAPVPRALVTLLGSDRDGFFGMGVRANASKENGEYELAGIKPGSYLVQVSRFQGRPLQSTFNLEVPDGAFEFRFDIDLPTSDVTGRVVDTRGNAVEGIQVNLGQEEGGMSGSDGLLGMIAQSGFGQARTNAQGAFTIRSVTPGTYRLTAGGEFGGGGRRGRGSGNSGGSNRHGQGSLGGIVVDGATSVQNLLITVPLAGGIKGIVLDASGNPVKGAEITFQDRNQVRRSRGNPLLDMLASQARPIASGDDGRFEIGGLSPSVYDLKADLEGSDTGKVADITVQEDQIAEVQVRIVRGAKIKLRATNVDKKQIPFAYLSLIDGQGKPVVNRVSTLTVMRRLMGGKDTVDDSGWYEFGSVPPDNYTAVIAEPGKPEIRITRAVADGETVEWDIDVEAELKARAGK